MLNCSRWAALLLLIIFLASFFGWGLVKVCNPDSYTEIQSETLPWEGEEVLPQLAVSRIGNVTVKIEHCTIRYGNVDSRICLDVKTEVCKLGNDQSQPKECLPPSLSVAGTFGEKVYRYVTLKVFAPKGSKGGMNRALSLWWEQRESPTWTGVLTQLYTWSEQNPMRSELFFQKVTALQGEPFGIFGRSGNDESEQLLQQKNYMVKKSEYSYAGERGETDNQGLILGQSLFLRASHTMREDFYEVYSLLRLLEAMGGLYTSISFLLFVPVIGAYQLFRHFGLLVDYCRHQHKPHDFVTAEMVAEEINFTGREPASSSQHTRLEMDHCCQHPLHAKVNVVNVVPEVPENNLHLDAHVKLPGMLLS